MFKTRDLKGQNRYVGASKATVIDNRDPNGRRRIRVNHPLLGETTWIEYLNDFGTYSMPAVGEIVYVQCDTGVYEFPFAWGKAPKGSFSNPDTPTPFQRTVPTNRGLYTPGGNYIEMDDGEATGSDPKDTKVSTKNRGIRITSKSGHSIVINDDPDNGQENIIIVDKAGDGIAFDSSTKKVSIISNGEMSLNSDSTLKVNSNAEVVVSANNTAQIGGKSGTIVGDNGSNTEVNGQQVALAGGGPGVARLGDRALGIGNAGAPVTSTIIQGSFKVTSG